MLLFPSWRRLPDNYFLITNVPDSVLGAGNTSVKDRQVHLWSLHSTQRDAKIKQANKHNMDDDEYE